MKRSLGKRPLGVKFAFILAVTLLLPGVTSKSIATTFPDVTNEPKAGDLEEKPDEEDALALFSLLVKRAVDEEMMDDSEEDQSEANSVDEDKFSISDLPKLLKPLIDAFSSDSSSEAPSKDDFLSWFPSLKDLFDSNKPKATEATNGATRSGRRSSFFTASEPSLLAPPASSQPPEPEIASSSQPYAFIATVPPITRHPITEAGPSRQPFVPSEVPSN